VVARAVLGEPGAPLPTLDTGTISTRPMLSRK
jgi:hypothetical protein